jgi:hypothetical protein
VQALSSVCVVVCLCRGRRWGLGASLELGWGGERGGARVLSSYVRMCTCLFMLWEAVGP